MMKDKHDMIQIVKERLRVFLQNNLGQVEYLRTDVKDKDYIHDTGEMTTHVMAEYGHASVCFVAALTKTDKAMALPLYDESIYTRTKIDPKFGGDNLIKRVDKGVDREANDEEIDARIDALIEEHLGDELRKMFVAVNPAWVKDSHG